MNSNKERTVKLLAAVIGGGAVVTMGLLTTATSHEQVNAKVIQPGGMNMGGTSVQKAPATTIVTAKAVPVVKASHR